MRSIFYLMSLPAHLPYLVTSLYTLRRHWKGALTVFAWRESYELVSRIVQDPYILANCELRPPLYRGKNDQFLDKIKLAQAQPDNTTNLYLDADTLIVGNLDKLFVAAEKHGFAATQFNDWLTDGGVVKNRISRLYPFEAIDDNLITEVISNPYPSVNGGVFCSRPTSEVLKVWYRWSYDARSIFIADECVLHLMVPKFEPEGKLVVIEGGAFNASPKYAYRSDMEPVKIWHGHGDCFVRPQKSPRGVEMWMSVFNECRRKNVGGINKWWMTCENRFLNELMLDWSGTSTEKRA